MFEGHEEGMSLNYNQMHMDDHDLNKHMQVEGNNGKIFKHLWKINEKDQKFDCTIYFYDHYVQFMQHIYETWIGCLQLNVWHN